jgi:hypothetical protein
VHGARRTSILRRPLIANLLRVPSLRIPPGSCSMTALPAASTPKVLEPIQRQLGFAHGVLDVAVTKPSLWGAGIVAGIWRAHSRKHAAVRADGSERAFLRESRILMAPECGHQGFTNRQPFPVMLGLRRPTRPTHSIPVAPAAQTSAGAIGLDSRSCNPAPGRQGTECTARWKRGTSPIA